MKGQLSREPNGPLVLVAELSTVMECLARNAQKRGGNADAPLCVEDTEGFPRVGKDRAALSRREPICRAPHDRQQDNSIDLAAESRASFGFGRRHTNLAKIDRL